MHRKLQNSVNTARPVCAISRCIAARHLIMWAFHHIHLLSHTSLKSCVGQHVFCELSLILHRTLPARFCTLHFAIEILISLIFL